MTIYESSEVIPSTVVLPRSRGEWKFPSTTSQHHECGTTYLHPESLTENKL